MNCELWIFGRRFRAVPHVTRFAGKYVRVAGRQRRGQSLREVFYNNTIPGTIGQQGTYLPIAATDGDVIQPFLSSTLTTVEIWVYAR